MSSGFILFATALPPPSPNSDRNDDHHLRPPKNWRTAFQRGSTGAPRPFWVTSRRVGVTYATPHGAPDPKSKASSFLDLMAVQHQFNVPAPRCSLPGG